MPKKKWRTMNGGGIAFEDLMTGDGRIWTDGAWVWENPADIPLQWNPEDNSSHEGTLTFGAVESIVRVDGRLEAEGWLDDELPRAEELLARMAQGLASGVSVVFDDVVVEVVSTVPAESEQPVMVMATAARVQLGSGGVLLVEEAPPTVRTILAAAGDPDPEDGEVLFEDASDSMVFRFTRSRIRALTLVDVPAFIDARIELTGEEVGEAVEGPDGQEAEGGLPVAASAGPVLPPREWFDFPEPADDSPLWVEQDGGQWAVPLTITDDGQVYGHACFWGQCHVGYLEACVSPPVSDDRFLQAQLELGSQGELIRPGFLTGCTRVQGYTRDPVDVPTAPLFLHSDHPDAYLFAREAQDAYAHTGMAWADVTAVQTPAGVWVRGAVRPDVTPAQLRVCRASALSGDWRVVPPYTTPQLIALLTVSRPGFPIARSLAASGAILPPAPTMFVEYDDAGELVRASGLGVVRHLCPGCLEAQREQFSLGVFEQEALRILRALEVRTRHQLPVAAAAAMERIRPR